ncbi:olfactory receptor 5V1-like [Ambystoma mexicanum]|uniref:olfactory receptor 5V1-like n=1 Tax=Ambystoma mexicanum TaxID=8296 RepID=UPI0037E775B5
MEEENQTHIYQFILMGLSTKPEVQLFLAALFILTYISIIAGNLLILLVIRMNPHLHTPMYFFLGNLSFLDVCSSSVTVPKMLAGLLVKEKTISVHGCFTQLFFFISFTCAEIFLLSAMSYDRYVAICKPLHYTVIMNMRFCTQLAVSSWSGGSAYSLLHTLLASRLSFCRSNIIDHFFCDLPPLYKISCTDIFINILVVFTTGGLLGLVSLLVAFVSYSHIISAVLRIASTEGKHRAFSTCFAHLTVVIIFYGSLSFMYLRNTSSYQLVTDRGVSIVYTVITPLLNPLIYSLRNRDIKEAISKAFGKKA